MGARHDEFPNGQGRLLANRRIALYRDESGIFHPLSSVCLHRGRDVDWNGEEKVWDCPCHGSRFAPDGAVLRGPSAQALLPVDVPE